MSPVKYLVVMIMRATQKKMMSKPVTSTALGRKNLSCAQFATSRRARFHRAVAGQPSVENGHSAEREPGVEHVVVLAQRADRWRAGVRARVGFVLAHVDVAGLVVPRRDAMAPPQLAADAPVLDVVHPLRVGLRPVLRHELDVAVAHCVQRRLGDRLAAAWTSIRLASESGRRTTGRSASARSPRPCARRAAPAACAAWFRPAGRRLRGRRAPPCAPRSDRGRGTSRGALSLSASRRA